jgi:hypothetical protein
MYEKWTQHRQGTKYGIQGPSRRMSHRKIAANGSCVRVSCKISLNERTEICGTFHKRKAFLKVQTEAMK